MAKLKMMKIELIALLRDSKRIIELLQRRGVVEMTDCCDEGLIKTNASAAISQFERFRSSAQNALDIINKYSPEKKSLIDSFSARKEIDTDSFGENAKKFEKTMQGAAAVSRSFRRISECEAELSQLKIKRASLEQWDKLDIALGFKGTVSTSCFIGTLPKFYSQDELEELLGSEAAVSVISFTKIQTNVFVICRKAFAEEIYSTLRRNGFASAAEQETRTPAQITADIDKRIKTLEAEIDKNTETIKGYAGIRRDLEFTVDYLQMRKDKYEALNKLAFTENTFVLNGFVPQKYAESLCRLIEKKYTAAARVYEPDEDEDTPVLLENSRFSAPVEGITEMYALPNKRDVDPTPVMSFFYYLFFGMMLSDAGYGLIMLIGTTIALHKIRLEEKMRKTLIMFRNCGVSTLIFGALFGSWFGDIIQVVGEQFFHKEIGSVALWFEPIDDPIKLLLYSFALGICHLFLGLAVAFKMKWSEGDKFGAVFDTIPVCVTILGVCPAAASILSEVPSQLISIGLYAAVVGVVVLVLTAGRSAKGIFGKLFGGLYALYNTATGYLSDILSYSRLLALGLATGSIAGVINLIGTMPENMVIKGILLTVVFIVGHTANLGINLLGAYVHTDRLQFVELFSKFYEGGGRAFDPLTVKTNYYIFKEESINE